MMPQAPRGIYDYSRRMSKPDDKLSFLDIAWDSDIVSEKGAHYHFYLPLFLKSFGKSIVNEILATCIQAARAHGDPVHYSFEFIQEENGRGN
jgi:hypothetical protein